MITHATGRLCPAEPGVCLLGGIGPPIRKGRKMGYKFTQLALLLARRRVAITWMGQESPKVERWLSDVSEWSLAEMIRLKKCRTDEKLEEDLEQWSLLLARLRPEGEEVHDGEVSNTEEEEG